LVRYIIKPIYSEYSSGKYTHLFLLEQQQSKSDNMQLKKLAAVAGWKILHIIFSYNHIHIYLYEKILIITEFFIIQRNFINQTS